MPTTTPEKQQSIQGFMASQSWSLGPFLCNKRVEWEGVGGGGGGYAGPVVILIGPIWESSTMVSTVTSF